MQPVARAAGIPIELRIDAGRLKAVAGIPYTISFAASELDTRTPADERLSLAFAPGDNSYPLINYEYAVVSTRQPDPAVAKALRDFLLWANSPVGGNTPKYLDAAHFVALPDFIRASSEKQIRTIK